MSVAKATKTYSMEAESNTAPSLHGISGNEKPHATGLGSVLNKALDAEVGYRSQSYCL